MNVNRKLLKERIALRLGCLLSKCEITKLKGKFTNQGDAFSDFEDWRINGYTMSKFNITILCDNILVDPWPITNIILEEIYRLGLGAMVIYGPYTTLRSQGPLLAKYQMGGLTFPDKTFRDNRLKAKQLLKSQNEIDI